MHIAARRTIFALAVERTPVKFNTITSRVKYDNHTGKGIPCTILAIVNDQMGHRLARR
jgi:hypothetical protein